jgi:hypothetical protein
MISLYKELVLYANNSTQNRILLKKDGIKMDDLQQEFNILTEIYSDYIYWYLNNYTSKNHRSVISMYTPKPNIHPRNIRRQLSKSIVK